jgi:hypothetical protein
MCLSAAVTDSEPAAVSGDVLSEEELDIVTHPEDYEVRLKCMEWWARFRSWLETWRT